MNPRNLAVSVSENDLNRSGPCVSTSVFISQAAQQNPVQMQIDAMVEQQRADDQLLENGATEEGEIEDDYVDVQEDGEVVE